MISHTANKNAGDSCPCQKIWIKIHDVAKLSTFFFRTSKMSWQARWHCKVRLKSIQSCLSLGKIRFTKILKYKWRKLSISLLPKKPPVFYPLALFFNLQNSVHTHQKCEMRWRARWSNWEDLKVSQHFIRIMMAAIFFWKRRDLLHVGKKKKNL